MVTISPAAKRQIKNLEPKIQEKIVQHLREIGKNPRPSGTKKLSGTRDVYRLRIGDYRVVYQIRGDELIILILGVGHRQEIYKKLQILAGSRKG